MTSVAIFETAHYEFDRRVILLAISLSIAAHFAFLATRPDWLSIWSSPVAESRSVSVQIQATPELPVATDRSPVSRDTREVVPRERAPRDSAVPPAVEPAERHNTTQPPLDLDTEAMLSELLLHEGAGGDDRLYSDNGAVVMNRELREFINRAPRASLGALPESTLGGGMDGVTPTQFFRMGDACFQVQSANPLEPISHEMWFRIACPE